MIRIRLLLAFALVTTLTACSSVPLGTMWKLSRLGPEALFEADPTEIRAAALSERWFLDRPGFDAGVLKVGIESPSLGDLEWSFALDEVSDREAWRLDSAPTEQRWRVYRISPEDLEAFQGLQRELPGLIETAKAGEGTNQFLLSVKFGTEEGRAQTADRDADEKPDSIRVLPYRVDLQLDQDEGFFTLMRDDDLEVPMYTDEGDDDDPL